MTSTVHHCSIINVRTLCAHANRCFATFDNLVSTLRLILIVELFSQKGAYFSPLFQSIACTHPGPGLYIHGNEDSRIESNEHRSFLSLGRRRRSNLVLHAGTLDNSKIICIWLHCLSVWDKDTMVAHRFNYKVNNSEFRLSVQEQQLWNLNSLNNVEQQLILVMIIVIDIDC